MFTVIIGHVLGVG